MTFDTHDAANRLKAAGFTEPQVEALVDVARVTTTLPDISTLATKADLVASTLATKADLAALRVDLERGQAELRSELKSDFNDLRTDFNGLKNDVAGLRTEFTS